MKLLSDLVAFDIGTQSLKCLTLSPGRSGVGFRITDLYIEELPGGLIGGGFTNPFIRDLAAFSRHMKNLLRKMSSQKQGCIIGVPDRWVKLHIQNLLLKADEVANSEFITWRLAKVLPIPENIHVVIDHQILSLEETEEGIHACVMAGALRQDMTHILSQVFANLHLQVMGFESSTMGVYNLLEDAQPENSIDRNLIMCHVGHETTVVKIFHHGVLAYERVIEVGGEEIGHMYAIADHLSPEDGQTLKSRLCLFHEDRAKILQLIRTRHLLERVFGNWLRELNVTFRFYQEKFKVLHLPKIYLTGGACMFDGMPEFLSEYFETGCFRFNPFADLPAEKEVKPEHFKLGPQFAPCLSLLSM